MFSEGAQLLGEINEEAPSLPEPVVVGDPCEEGVRGRFVLVQKDTGGTTAGMKLGKVLVNHTEKGEIANVDRYLMTSSIFAEIEWVKVFSHDVSGGYFNDAADTMSKNPNDENSRLFSILDQLERLSTSLGVFRLRQCYPEHDQPNCNEWVQSSNPVKESAITGFKAINWVRTKNSRGQLFGGLGLNENYDHSLLDDVPKNTPNKCHCFHSIGSTGEAWEGSGRLPGPSDAGNERKVRKVELYMAVVRGWLPCPVPALCEEEEMCDSRFGRNHCASIPPACPTDPLLVADSSDGCLCSAAEAICEKGERCDVDEKVCSPLAECQSPEGRPMMAIDHPTQESFDTDPMDGWEDMKLSLPEIPILGKDSTGAVLGFINGSSIFDLSGTYLGEVDFTREEISKDGVTFGRLERWSNGYMIIVEDIVVGKLEERFLEGMNATFQCFHHHFVIGRVS